MHPGQQEVMDAKAVQYEHEVFLICSGLMEVLRAGRRITAKGRDYPVSNPRK